VRAKVIPKIKDRTRLTNDILIDESTGCWNWQRSYKTISIEGDDFLVKRVFYSTYVKDPGDGIVKNSCDGESCMNPEHLILLIRADFYKIKTGASSINRYKEECKRGHIFDSQNTATAKDGTRRCRKCDILNANSYRQRNLEKCKIASRKAKSRYTLTKFMEREFSKIALGEQANDPT
jgi:hypothetical protein